MFTFGLFSTHMPYVVMVVFYVLYFLFASPSSTQITVGSNPGEQIATEQVHQNITKTADNTHWYYFSFASTLSNQTGWTTTDLRKFYDPPDKKPKQDKYCSELFCRPPPCVS